MRINVSIPAVAGKIHSIISQANGSTTVSIPAVAGKIHHPVAGSLITLGVSIPAVAGKIHIQNLVLWHIHWPFQFPQLRVRYMHKTGEFQGVHLFQFPQLRVRYIAKITKAHCISAAQFVQLSIFASFIIAEV